MVTPEIAAFVVKDYLLPMFESDGKKLMTKKLTTGANNKRSQSNNEKISPKEAKIENNIDGLTPKDYKQIKLQGNEPLQDASGTMQDGKTVYSELKLSEILLAEVDAYKNIITKKDE